jgi:hypothetical protein
MPRCRNKRMACCWFTGAARCPTPLLLLHGGCEVPTTIAAMTHLAAPFISAHRCAAGNAAVKQPPCIKCMMPSTCTFLHNLYTLEDHTMWAPWPRTGAHTNAPTHLEAPVNTRHCAAAPCSAPHRHCAEACGDVAWQSLHCPLRAAQRLQVIVLVLVLPLVIVLVLIASGAAQEVQC